MTNCLTYSDELAFIGIEEFENYVVNVVGANRNGCIIELENGVRMLLQAGYPVGTELVVSFNIKEKTRHVFPVVEWVVTYGFDKAA